MANELVYTFTLKDRFTSKLQKILITSNTALDKFGALALKQQKLNDTTKHLARSLGTLRQKLELLKAEREWIPADNIRLIRTYNSEINKLSKQIQKLETINGSRLKTWINDAKSQIPSLLTNPLVMAGGTLIKAVRTGMEYELQQKSFSVLLGGEEAGREMMESIRQYAAKSGYGNVVSESVKTMLGFGVEAEKTMQIMKAIGDIAMGDKQKFNGLSLAFAQMYSTGNLRGQELLQMINAGFNPLYEISRKTGKSIGKLKKEMEKGAISAQMVTEAFMSATTGTGRYANMTEKLAQTAGGQLNIILGKLQNALIGTYNVVRPFLMPVLKITSAILSGLVKILGWMGKTIEWLKPFLLGLAETYALLRLRMMAVAIWSKISTFSIKKQVKAWNLLNWVTKKNVIIAILSIILSLINYLVEHTQGWGKVWKYTFEGAKWLLKAFVTAVKTHFITMVNAMMIAIDKIKMGWYEFKDAVGLGDATENMMMIQKIKQDTERRKQAILQSGKELKEATLKSAEAFGKAFQSIEWKKKGKKGIAIPGLAGMPGVMPMENEKDVAGSMARQTNQAIVTGGRKTQYITINLKSLVEMIQVSGRDFKESMEDMERETADALLRVLAMAVTTAK